MLQLIRQMPPGVLLFLAYAFVVLSILGLTMPVVIDQAVQTPVTFIGLVWMGLLAYLIFTMTLVLQRKQASRALALGLSSLTVPGVVLALLAAQPLFALIAAILGVLLFFGLTRPEVHAWLSEP